LQMASKAKTPTALEARKQHNQPQRQQYRVLDELTRNRRNRQFLEQLEKDNHHEDPHANLAMHKKAPKFDDSTIKNSSLSSSNTVGRRHAHRTRMLSFAALLEEDAKSPEPNYTNASIPPPSYVATPDGKILMSIPKRHFCSVCGFKAPYTCVTCGTRYCSVTCLGTHRDTRCLKWTA
jgi:zinc finger HIT domain-containing protein 1